MTQATNESKGWRQSLGKVGQQGFTLIEIIAVLVILGILAVVAIPKYMDLQEDARQSAAKGIIAAAQSELSLVYANAKLNGIATLPTPGDICSADNLGVDATNVPTLTCNGTLTTNSTITVKMKDQATAVTGVWNSPEE